jgi:hypothetical protein
MSWTNKRDLTIITYIVSISSYRLLQVDYFLLTVFSYIILYSISYLILWKSCFSNFKSPASNYRGFGASTSNSRRFSMEHRFEIGQFRSFAFVVKCSIAKRVFWVPKLGNLDF